MKSLLRVAAIVSMVAVAVVFTTSARAEEKTKPAAEKHQITGTVDAVDTTANSITVKGKLETKTLKVGDKTKISTADKKEATLGDVKTGDKVIVFYTGEDQATKIAPKGAPKKK